MKKIKNKIQNMKTSDWLMVSLWTFVLLMLFAFVGTVAGLTSKSKNVDTPAHWTFKLSDKANEKIVKGGSVTAAPKAIYKTQDEARKAEGKIIVSDSNKDADWVFDKLDGAVMSKEAETATNTIAAIALIFFLSLFVAIFGTAIIKFKERKAGK